MVWGYQQDMACREAISSLGIPSTAGKMNMFSDTQVSCRSERKQKQKRLFYTSAEFLARSLPSLLYSISWSN